MLGEQLALEQFKGTSNSGKKAFLKFLENTEYDNLRGNFYDDAEQFANELDTWKHLNPKVAKLAPLRRITRYYTDDAKVLFKIEHLTTLDKFF